MAKKKQQVTAEESQPILVAARRNFDNLRQYPAAEGEDFQIGARVTWNGSGRYVDRPDEEKLRGLIGTVVSARWSYMFGDFTNRTVLFEIDGKPVWVRAHTQELYYA